jgi:hypothetical protein
MLIVNIARLVAAAFALNIIRLVAITFIIAIIVTFFKLIYANA